MRRLTTGFAIIAVFLVAAASLWAEPQHTNLLIVEVQTGSAESATKEFVEIYNPNNSAIDVSDWVIEYKSASGANWSSKGQLAGEIQPRGRLLTSNYLDSSNEFSGGLAGSGGHVRLVQPNDVEDIVHDTLAWGSADSAEGNLPVEKANSGQSLKRLVDEDGYFVDSDENLADFFASDTPTPDEDLIIVTETEEESEEEIEEEQEVVEETVDTEQDAEPEEVDAVVEQEEQTPKIEYAALQITELFIDPEKPLLDSEDEFVEIYNPTNSSVELTGYIIETGNSFNHSFALPELQLAAGDYRAFYSIDTGLALSNSSGAARLKAPDGEVIFLVPGYEKAKAGTSWAINSEGVWGWSGEPSPAAPNTTALSATASEANKLVKEAAEETAKVVAGSVISASSESASEDSQRAVYEEPETEVTASLNRSILASVGSLAILYVGYEYRSDVSNRIFQLRRYLKDRFQNGKPS